MTERQLLMDANAVLHTHQLKGAVSFSLDAQELFSVTHQSALFLSSSSNKCVECTFFLLLSPPKLVCILNPELFPCVRASLQSVGTLQHILVHYCHTWIEGCIFCHPVSSCKQYSDKNIFCIALLEVTEPLKVQYVKTGHL